MALMRSILLAASQNTWLRENAVNYPFVRRSVSRFMPGESLDAAMEAARGLEQKKIASVFTNLGENVKDRAEASQVTEHYLEVLRRIHESGLNAEISVKLTQLGLDLSPDFCFENLERIIAQEKSGAIVWVDMEASPYVDATLDLYRQALAKYPNAGICLQAYLYRTQKDVEELLPRRPSIRLVKGAYKEPAEVAYPKKQDVDENYFSLATVMMAAQAADRCPRAAYGTHDVKLIRRLAEHAAQNGFPRSNIEVQMLYGIQREEQERLAREGYRSGVLVAYGTYWYPWFVRRLAERPANLWFMARNLFAS
ncbi:MAG TPA: proline dehydrogenase family protein [Candidatus Limnocylindrales bacterium]|nr:proline dehydrogenase family protein [Candidatus Limnocylindrales bacterium]